MEPIWRDKDVVISTGSAAAIDFTVEMVAPGGSELIYRGRGYRRPGASSISIRLNNIAADYLKNPFPRRFPQSGTILSDGAGSRQFRVSSAETGALVNFVNDWSYDDNVADSSSQFRQVLFLFTDIDRRMPLIYTIVANGSQTNRVEVNRDPEPPYVIGNYTLYVGVETCFRYVLYFLNAYGGWSFTYLEAVKIAETYDRKTAGRIGNNVGVYGIPDPTEVNFVNEVARRWTAKTPYLTDAQSKDIWHLLGTTEAWLFDMESQAIFPVLLENNNYEEKTYYNQGAKRVRYDINLTLAQNRLRR